MSYTTNIYTGYGVRISLDDCDDPVKVNEVVEKCFNLDYDFEEDLHIVRDGENAVVIIARAGGSWIEDEACDEVDLSKINEAREQLDKFLRLVGEPMPENLNVMVDVETF